MRKAELFGRVIADVGVLLNPHSSSLPLAAACLSARPGIMDNTLTSGGRGAEALRAALGEVRAAAVAANAGMAARLRIPQVRLRCAVCLCLTV